MGENLKDTDVVIITMSRWDIIYSSAIISMAREICKTHRVFYFDHPFTLKDFIRNYSSEEIKRRRKFLFWKKNSYTQVSKFSNNFIAVTPGLTVPINWLPEGKIYNFFHWFNDQIFLSSLRKTIKDFNIKKFVYLNSFDPFYGINLPDDITPLVKVYQTRDDINGESYIAKHGVKHEKEAVNWADFTLATSKELTKAHSSYSDRVKFLPNAADIALFKQALDKLPKPEELTLVKNKILLYIGNIEGRIDYALLQNILKYHQDKTLVLVGPISTNELDSFGLRDFPNLILTGPKKLEDLPSYLKYADCTLIPFKCNKLTKNIYPLKINEYLASGKPVVSTAFSPDLIDFDEIIYISKDHNSFLENINKALIEDAEDKARKRIRIAETNSWESRSKDFWKYINQHLIKKTGIEYAEQRST